MDSDEERELMMPPDGIIRKYVARPRPRYVLTYLEKGSKPIGLRHPSEWAGGDPRRSCAQIERVQDWLRKARPEAELAASQRGQQNYNDQDGTSDQSSIRNLETVSSGQSVVHPKVAGAMPKNLCK